MRVDILHSPLLRHVHLIGIWRHLWRLRYLRQHHFLILLRIRLNIQLRHCWHLLIQMLHLIVIKNGVLLGHFLYLHLWHLQLIGIFLLVQLDFIFVPVFRLVFATAVEHVLNLLLNLRQFLLLLNSNLLLLFLELI